MIIRTRNRDYLDRMSLYDELILIQKNWNQNCLLKAIDNNIKCPNLNCEDCIREWLNSDRWEISDN